MLGSGVSIFTMSVSSGCGGLGFVTLRRGSRIGATATISGAEAQGFSSGQAMDVMKQIADHVLPPGTGFAWSGMSYQEQAVGNRLYGTTQYGGGMYGYGTIFLIEK